MIPRDARKTGSSRRIRHEFTEIRQGLVSYRYILPFPNHGPALLAMLTGNLVRVAMVKDRIVPKYLNRNQPQWLEVAESLLLIFREGIGSTRGEIEDEIHELVGEGMATLAHRGLAKVLEDRATFEVVSEIDPEVLREKVFSAAALHRRELHAAHKANPADRTRFRGDLVLSQVAVELNLNPETIQTALFADLKDENRLLGFDDLTAVRLIDRYNVALAQAILLRSVAIRLEIRRETPIRYRQILRQLKFHRLLYRVEGTMSEGYLLHVDGPLSLFSATSRYGVQMANFLPTLLHCNDFRLDAELRWGPQKTPSSFHLEPRDGLVSHQDDTGTFIPTEYKAFVDRFRQVAPDWELSDTTEIMELGREGVWIPDYRIVHRRSGFEVFVEVLGFWKQAGLDRLARLLPLHCRHPYLLAVSDRLKVDESDANHAEGPFVKFKEIPNAPELLARLELLRRDKARS